MFREGTKSTVGTLHSETYSPGQGIRSEVAAISAVGFINQLLCHLR